MYILFDGALNTIFNNISVISWVVVHYLQMCMKKYGHCPKFGRGDKFNLCFHEKKEGMYLVSATPPKQHIGFL
jgi:hypothetical protein